MSCLFQALSQFPMQPSTGDEKEVKKVRMHKGKLLELLCLDREDGSILGSINFQVHLI